MPARPCRGRRRRRFYCEDGLVGRGADKSDPSAGLEVAIENWRGAILKGEAACRQPDGPEGPACQRFEVTCKVESPIEEGERASGVSQKVLAAITWQARDPAMN